MDDISKDAQDDENNQNQNQEQQGTDDENLRPKPKGGWNTIEEDPTKIKMKRNFTDLASGTVDFLKSVLSLRHSNYDHRRILKDAQENVVFKGYNVWVLVCSIVVASIGLNMDSYAVVIGAMLISPLMGPIRGIGFGVGMNDLNLLFKSMKNFGVMVGVSLATSVIYFMISPIDIVTAELLGRTEPNFLDAMIAFFGGLAGIIASANGKTDTVVSGVAIATALMPPLCTAGYGIANAEWTYFLGASYLFLLNSLFIAFSTVVFLRYARFPKRQYISSKIERRVRNYVIIFLVLILTPSGYLFYKMTKRSIFEANVIEFVDEIVLNTRDNMRVTTATDFSLSNPVIELSVYNTHIDTATYRMWNRQKKQYNLEKARIKIIQDDDIRAFTEKRIEEAFSKTAGNMELFSMLQEKDNTIMTLQNDFETYKRNPTYKEDPLKIDYLLRRFKKEYSELNNIAINRSFIYNEKSQIDTSYVIAVKFDKKVSPSEQKKLKSRISKSFCFELGERTNMKLDSVQVINF